MTPSVFGKLGQPRKPFYPLEPVAINPTFTQLTKVIASKEEILQALLGIEAAMEEPVWMTLSVQHKETLKQDVTTWTTSTFDDVSKRATEVLAKF